MLRCICPTGWNAGFHTWVMVGYGFELLEYCRRERFPGGLWDQLTLDFGLVTLLSIVIYLRAQAARPLAIIAWFSEFVLVDWTFMMFTLHHYVMAQAWICFSLHVLDV